MIIIRFYVQQLMDFISGNILRLQLYLPEDVEIAHKCGDLDFLEHDAGIVLLPKRPYLIVVLTKDNPTNQDGREVIGTVSRMVYEEMLKKE